VPIYTRESTLTSNTHTINQLKEPDDSVERAPDWSLIHLKKWADQIGIHYHTARKLKKNGVVKTVKVGAQDFVSVEEARRIAREGAC